MYPILLAVHNVLRWLVVAAAVWALFRTYRGWLGSRDWSPTDRLTGLIFTISVDVQLVIGLFLAALSPLVRSALQDMSALSSSEVIRFFVTEHIPAMVGAWLIVHLTSVFARRADSDRSRHMRTALGFSLAVGLVLIATPWWRPLLPGL